MSVGVRVKRVRGDTPSPRVVVVDDNHLIRRLLALILEGAGFAAIEAESAEDALELGRDEPPVAWLVDEVMPAVKGSDLIRALRRSRDPRLARAVVVGMSGRTGAGAELLAAGADAFVPKPIDERALLTALVRALQTRGAAPEPLPAA
jgi:DNA-binding response OmpR family regulator